jgi:carbon-monoxide dehydrogenase small subunit
VKIQCEINGTKTSLSGFPMTRLLDGLRQHKLSVESDLLTGTKEGCGEGECGACSVFVDGELVNSCLVPLMQMEGAVIQTIEGLAFFDPAKKEFILHEVQKSFCQYGGAQCGICTPGMILAAVNILKKNPSPTLDDIKEGLAGNLCRCTGYMRIFESVLKTLKKELP